MTTRGTLRHYELLAAGISGGGWHSAAEVYRLAGIGGADREALNVAVARGLILRRELRPGSNRWEYRCA